MLVAADEPGSGIDGMQALRKTTLGDVHILTGTVVIGVMRRKGTSDRHVPRAAAFESERWLDEGGPTPRNRANCCSWRWPRWA